MKIAFVADDEQTISAHFGRAPYVVVVTVEAGQEVAREVRSKPHNREGQHNQEHVRRHGHTRDDIAASMADCDVMVVRGIGRPAMGHAQTLGLQVILPREKHIDEALAAYLAGTLQSDERRIHRHESR